MSQELEGRVAIVADRKYKRQALITAGARAPRAPSGHAPARTASTIASRNGSSRAGMYCA